MKCPYDHTTMTYTKGESVKEYYFVCPKCGRTIGKKETKESDKKSDE